MIFSPSCAICILLSTFPVSLGNQGDALVTDLQEKVSYAFCDLTFSLLRDSTPSSANSDNVSLHHPTQPNNVALHHHTQPEDVNPNHIHPAIHIDDIRELGLKFGLLRGRGTSRNTTKLSDTKRLCCPTCREIVDRFQKSITLDDLLDCFELHGAEKTTISSSQYRSLCPALVYAFLVVGGPTSISADPSPAYNQSGCGKHHTCCHHHHPGHEHHPPIADKAARTVKESPWKMYVIAIICTGVVCLASMVGIFLFPLLPHNYYNGLTSFMSSLAVGTLAGDALLHLIPHAYGLHSHASVVADAANGNLTSRIPRCASHCEHGHDGHSSDYLMKTLVVISGIYLFYLIDVITSKLPGGQDASHHHHHQHNRRYSTTKGEDQLSSTTNKGLHINLNANTHVRVGASGAEGEAGKTLDEDFKIATRNNRRSATALEPSVSDDSEQQPLHTSTRRRSLRTRVHDFFASVRYVQRYAWVVLIADSVHNVSDGVTIGAAFGANMELGLTTTLAVLLHELPHELGDYAILITSGFTHLQALFFNLVTALTAYIGLLIGFLLSSGSEATQQWTLAAAAGIFLYVALVDLFPLLLPSADTSNWDVALHNAGLLLGFVIMFLLAAYEDKIKLPF